MVVAFMPVHTFSFVLMSALILFYFAGRNRSKFKFDLNSKKFVNWKIVWNIEKVLTLKYGHGPKHPPPAQTGFVSLLYMRPA
jgi:hypothetical protein